MYGREDRVKLLERCFIAPIQGPRTWILVVCFSEMRGIDCSFRLARNIVEIQEYMNVLC